MACLQQLVLDSTSRPFRRIWPAERNCSVEPPVGVIVNVVVACCPGALIVIEVGLGVNTT